MNRTTRWSLVLGLAAAASFAIPAMTDVFAKGGGGGGPGGGGGGPSTGGGGGGGKSPGGKGGGAPTGGGGGTTGGGGGAGQGAGAKPKSNTGSTQGRGDYLESLQRDGADDARAAFLDDATREPVRKLRGEDRGE